MELLEASLGSIFLSEVAGTAMLLLLGGGVVANTLLKNSKGEGTGWLLINWGWGIGVFMGVIVAYNSGGHLNPAVTLGLWANGAKEMGGLPVTPVVILVYIVAQMLGAMLGAFFMWLTYKQHIDAHPESGPKLWIFATAPQIRSPFWNTLTEVIGTFVLVFGVIAAGKYTGIQGPLGEGPANLGWLGALGVALLVFGIGVSLGGPTGYAINPARDLGPRIMHAILPIKGKGDSDWGYSWVPIVGPILGGVIAGLLGQVVLP